MLLAIEKVKDLPLWRAAAEADEQPRHPRPIFN
jgi:hypothetical protein